MAVGGGYNAGWVGMGFVCVLSCRQPASQWVRADESEHTMGFISHRPQEPLANVWLRVEELETQAEEAMLRRGACVSYLDAADMMICVRPGRAEPPMTLTGQFAGLRGSGSPGSQRPVLLVTSFLLGTETNRIPQLQGR